MSNREKSKGLRNFLLAPSAIPLRVSGHRPIAAILHPHPRYFSQPCPRFTPRTMLHATTQQTPSTGIRAKSRWQPDNPSSIPSTSTSPIPYLNTPVSALSTFPPHSTHPVICHTHPSLQYYPTAGIRNSSALRLLSSAVPYTPKSVPFGRRGYAEVADKIKLSLVLPHQAIFTSADMDWVDISAATNDMGTLANHVSSIEPPRPGVVEVIECRNASENSVVPGCPATVHPNNELTINAVLPASPSTTLPLLSPSERTSYITFESSSHREPVAILSRNVGACHLTVTPTTVTTEFASTLHLCCYYRSPQQAHNQHGRGCSPGVSSANQIGPADESFDNAPTPSVRSKDGLDRIQVVPPAEEPIAIPSRNVNALQVRRQAGVSLSASPGVSSTNQISPVDESFDNAPTPSIRSEGGLGRVQVVPLLGLEQIKVHQVFAIPSSIPPVLHRGYYRRHHLHDASFVLRPSRAFSVEAVWTNLTEAQKIVVGDCVEG